MSGALSVHDLHIWTLSPGNAALTVHVLAESDVNYADLLHQIGEMICLKHGIHHSTIQIELQEGFHCKPIFCTPRQDSNVIKSVPVPV
jgi:cobalt-zinc-cadmium efflux system protein